MDLFQNILMGLGALTLISLIFLIILMVFITPRDLPDDYDETQDDFERSMHRWADVQERKSQ